MIYLFVLHELPQKLGCVSLADCNGVEPLEDVAMLVLKLFYAVGWKRNVF